MSVDLTQLQKDLELLEARSDDEDDIGEVVFDLEAELKKQEAELAQLVQSFGFEDAQPEEKDDNEEELRKKQQE